MKNFMTSLSLLVLVVAMVPLAQSEGYHPVQKYTDLPNRQFSFIQNRGQWREDVLFRAESGGVVYWLMRDGICYQFIDSDSTMPAADISDRHSLDDSGDRLQQVIRYYAVRQKFGSCNSAARFAGKEQLERRVNYFIGDDPEAWIVDVPCFSRVVVTDIYPGIDLEYYGTDDGRLEYDIKISPGADPSAVVVGYEGAQSTYLDNDGSLVFETPWGISRETIAQSRFASETQTGQLTARFRELGENVYGLTTDLASSASYSMVIDPVLTHSSFLRKNLSGDQYVNDLAVDPCGDVYAVGYVSYGVFPEKYGSQEMVTNSSDVSVNRLRYTVNSTSVVYTTYIGGNGDDAARAVAIDPDGNVVVVGYAQIGFPTVNALDATPPVTGGDYGFCGYKAFVAMFSGIGGRLIFSTYLGGNSQLENSRTDAYDVALKANGEICVVGRTNTTDFPLVNEIYDQSIITNSAPVGFLTIYSPYGQSYFTSTLYGGENCDVVGSSTTCRAIAIAPDQSLWITGSAIETTNHPTVNGLQVPNDWCVYFAPHDFGPFVAQFSPDGRSLYFSSLIGAHSSGLTGWGEGGADIAIAPDGMIWFAGGTNNPWFPLVNAIDSVFADTCSGANCDACRPTAEEGFVCCLDPSADTLVFSSFWGGSLCEYIYDLEINSLGDVFLSGYTGSTDFQNVSAIEGSAFPGVFVSKLSANDLIVDYSTPFPGAVLTDWYGIGSGTGMTLHQGGEVHFSGWSSTGIPTVLPIALSSFPNAFVATFGTTSCLNASWGGANPFRTYLDCGGAIHLEVMGCVRDPHTGLCDNNQYPGMLTLYFQVDKSCYARADSIRLYPSGGSGKIFSSHLNNVVDRPGYYQYFLTFKNDGPVAPVYDLQLYDDNDLIGVIPDVLYYVFDPLFLDYPQGMISGGIPPLEKAIAGSVRNASGNCDNGIPEAEVTLYKYDSLFAEFIPASISEISPPANPLMTNIYGAYSWQVPSGDYYISVKANGFEDVDSSAIQTVPPDLAIDVAMTPIVADSTPPILGYSAYVAGGQVNFVLIAYDEVAGIGGATVNFDTSAVIYNLEPVGTSISDDEDTLYWTWTFIDPSDSAFLDVKTVDRYGNCTIDRITAPAFAGICGDPNSDAGINIADAVFLINYIFKGGPSPIPLESGDADCDTAVNVGDAVYLINYVFKGGPAPCENCP